MEFRVSEPAEGMRIDVRDTEYVWCVAIILKVLTNKKHANTLFIHYEVSFFTPA
jgi:hypothetical protein